MHFKSGKMRTTVADKPDDRVINFSDAGETVYNSPRYASPYVFVRFLLDYYSDVSYKDFSE